MSQGITLIHFVFTPYKRIPLLAEPINAAIVENRIRRAMQQQGAEVFALAIMPDHVHLMVSLPRTKTIARLAEQAKCQSSLIMRRVFPELKDYPRFWGRRYWHDSIGGNKAKITQYIENQMRQINEKA